uniref:Uncharacterized protein n=1 Tax=Ixodes ricinus TaxID=34613 RepID=A0A6B0V428_IXORI
MAAVMRDCASRTRRMASSISLWAASELLACGLTIELFEWLILSERPANSMPLNWSARPTLLCSVNSTKAKRVGWLSPPAMRTYFTSPIWLKNLSSCSVVADESRFPTYTVRRISSTLVGSIVAGSGGYGGSPSAASWGSWVVITWTPPAPMATWLTSPGDRAAMVGSSGTADTGVVSASARLSSGSLPSVTGTTIRALSTKTVLVRCWATPTLQGSS